MSADCRTPRPWAEGVEPTADQLASFLAICTHPERVAYVTAMRNLARDASRCFMENHDGRIEQATAVMQEAADHWQRGYDRGLEDARHLPRDEAQR